jgi:hypothetical protein
MSAEAGRIDVEMQELEAENLNPVEGIKRMFTLDNAVEVLKALGAVAVLAAIVLGAVVAVRREEDDRHRVEGAPCLAQSGRGGAGVGEIARAFQKVPVYLHVVLLGGRRIEGRLAVVGAIENNAVFSAGHVGQPRCGGRGRPVEDAGPTG